MAYPRYFDAESSGSQFAVAPFLAPCEVLNALQSVAAHASTDYAGPCYEYLWHARFVYADGESISYYSQGYGLPPASVVLAGRIETCAPPWDSYESILGSGPSARLSWESVLKVRVSSEDPTFYPVASEELKTTTHVTIYDYIPPLPITLTATQQGRDLLLTWDPLPAGYSSLALYQWVGYTYWDETGPHYVEREDFLGYIAGTQYLVEDYPFGGLPAPVFVWPDDVEIWYYGAATAPEGCQSEWVSVLAPWPKPGLMLGVRWAWKRYFTELAQKCPIEPNDPLTAALDKIGDRWAVTMIYRDVNLLTGAYYEYTEERYILQEPPP